MPFVAVYAPEEREKATSFLNKFIEQGFCIEFAPIGSPLNSPSWQQTVEESIARSTALIAIITDATLGDPSVRWRIKRAIALGKFILPVRIESVLPDYRRRHRGNPLVNFQWVHPNPEIVARQLGLCAAAEVNCFISYSRKDHRLVRRLMNLFSPLNIKTWHDVDQISLGAQWDDEIARAIRHSSHVLLAATPNSVASPNVRDELAYAIDARKPVLPCIFRTCELPLRIRRAQVIDFRDDFETAAKLLVTELTVWLEDAQRDIPPKFRFRRPEA